jgi:threonine dehydratase
MFHYRNHGADNGRVLAGIQVSKAERAEFTQHLNALHYPYTEESGNPAYRMFLSA